MSDRRYAIRRSPPSRPGLVGHSVVVRDDENGEYVSIESANQARREYGDWVRAFPVPRRYMIALDYRGVNRVYRDIHVVQGIGNYESYYEALAEAVLLNAEVRTNGRRRELAEKARELAEKAKVRAEADAIILARTTRPRGKRAAALWERHQYELRMKQQG